MAPNRLLSARLTTLALVLRGFHLVFLIIAMCLAGGILSFNHPCDGLDCQGNIAAGPFWFVWIFGGLDILMVILLQVAKRYPERMKPRIVGILQGVASGFVLGIGVFLVVFETNLADCASGVDLRRGNNVCAMIGVTSMFLFLAYIFSLAAGLVSLWAKKRKRTETEVRMDELQGERRAAARPPGYA